ncbi:MAG: ADP-dependent glucokinase/phosphofructokinase, partial [Candidatus Thorarchaeota archaeon]
MPYAAIWTQKLRETPNKVNPVQGVFVGYNACIDFLEYLDPNHLEGVYKENITPEIIKRIKAKKLPEKIETHDDFLVSLVLAISNGKAIQIPNYDSEEIQDWFSDIFDEADEHRMGGQSGIIANLLSQLGISTIVYIPNLSSVQARRFQSGNILFPVKNEDLGVFTLRNVTKCARPDAITKINWIFEYEEGLSFPIETMQ